MSSSETFFTKLAALVEENKIRNLRVRKQDGSVMLSSTPTFSYFYLLKFAFFSGWSILLGEPHTIFFGVMIMAFTAYWLLQQLRTLNRVEFDFHQKVVVIKSIWPKPETVAFRDIRDFEMDVDAQGNSPDRYQVFLICRDDTRIPLLDVSLEERAAALIALLRSIRN
jgi:hypothetical protein